MKKFVSNWSTLQGATASVDKPKLRNIFQVIDVDGDGHITLDEYKAVLRRNPGLFHWFNILNNNSLKNEGLEKSYGSSESQYSVRLKQ